MPLTSYAALQKAFTADIGGAANRAHIGKVYRASMQFLAGLDREPLRSRITNKKYFAFRSAGTLSRPVNAALFAARSGDWDKLDKALLHRSLSSLSPDAITKIVYSVAMAFCCFIDLTKQRDQKTPGTFFEYLIGHLVASHLGVNPITRIQVLNLDIETWLPTDFIFDLGKDRPKFHFPIKLSTRERIIQVFAHQRVIDGVFGTERFLGTPVILAETKRSVAKCEVTEICVPDQCRVYQLHMAQLKRLYYLDVPATYEKLNDVFPPIIVKSFGHFFFEADKLSA